jgi:thiol:disulfide interchange protein DsbD
VALLVEQTAVQPGTQVRVGVQFEMDKDWHIYWKNPGDSGEPPEIGWQLPEAVTASALQWPAPMRLKTSAGTDFGYAGNAVLLSTMRIPAAARPGSRLAIGGEVRWLVCHDICVPQRAEVKAEVRVAEAATVDERAKAALDAASQRIPRPLPASFELRVESACDKFVLTYAEQLSKAGSDEYFFPAEAEQIDNDEATPELRTGHSIISWLKKSDHLQHDPARLAGVLVFGGQEAYEVDALVRGGSKCLGAPVPKEFKR